MYSHFFSMNVKAMVGIFNRLRAWFAHFVIVYVFGWNYKRQNYDAYKKDRHVVIFLHTSMYDLLLNVLFSYALDLPFITVGSRRVKSPNTLSTGFCHLMYSFFDTVIIDGEKPLTSDIIVSELEDRDDFLFVLAPEGSQYRTDDLKPAFNTIAKRTQANIVLLDLDYAKHTIDLRTIVDKNVVIHSEYERIHELAIEELVQCYPLDAGQTFLIDKLLEKANRRTTSVLNINNSILRFGPFSVVLLVIAKIIYTTYL